MLCQSLAKIANIAHDNIPDIQCCVDNQTLSGLPIKRREILNRAGDKVPPCLVIAILITELWTWIYNFTHI